MSIRLQCGAIYMGEGANWVASIYMKDAASRRGSFSELQMVTNLLPEPGSIMWTCKPIFCYVVDHFDLSKQRVLFWAMTVQAALWVFLATGVGGYSGLLMATLTMSFVSALADGLIDGLVCAEGSQARYYRYVCEMSRICASLSIGVMAVVASLQAESVFVVAALTWIFACGTVRYARRVSVVNPDQKKAIAFSLSPRSFIPLAFTLLAVVAPRCDMFLFRQKVLRMSAGQQTAVNLSSTVARAIGVSSYQHLIAPRPQQNRVKICFIVWALPSLLWLFILYVPQLAYAERGLHEIASSIAFMECNILMQDFAFQLSPQLAATTFASLQAVGSVGYWLGRNSDFWFLRLLRVDVENLQETLLPMVVVCMVFRVVFAGLAIKLARHVKGQVDASTNKDDAKLI